MARKRQVKGGSAAVSALPTGALLIGKLVTALGLPADTSANLKGKTAHRFFSGERIEDRKVAEIFVTLGNVFIEVGTAPSSAWRPTRGLPPAQRAGLALHHMVSGWDSTIAALRGDVLHDVAPKLVAVAAARLLVVDLALRVAAWLALVGVVLDDTAEATPPPNTAAILGGLVERTKLSREEIAKRCKVERTTVDDWVHGARITDDNLSNLVLLAGNVDETDATLQRTRRELVIASVLAQLRTYSGPDYSAQVDDLWRGLARLATRFSGYMATSRLLGEERFEPPGAVLSGGVASAPAPYVLCNALKQESSGAWVAALEVGPDWAEYLIHVARVARSAGSAAKVGFSEELDRVARLAMLDRPRLHMPTVPPEWMVVRVTGDDDAKASNRIAQYYDAVARGDDTDALGHASRAVDLTPCAWLPHFLLGAVRGRTGDVGGGISECETAAQLATAPDDVMKTKVEVGIILTNVGRHEESCAYLESLLAATTHESIHLLYNVGVVRMRCGMFDGGLDAFKRVLAEDGHHPRALDLAAHCAFALGDRRVGIAYAKQANLLGEPETYNAWQIGMYERRKEGKK